MTGIEEYSTPGDVEPERYQGVGIQTNRSVQGGSLSHLAFQTFLAYIHEAPCLLTFAHVVPVLANPFPAWRSPARLSSSRSRDPYL